MFENTHMHQVRKGKPHIQLIGGFWRISAMKRPMYDQSTRWAKAYSFICEKNRVKEL